MKFNPNSILRMLPSVQPQMRNSLSHSKANNLVATAQQQLAPGGKEVIANAPVTTTVFSPSNVGDGLVKMGQSLPEATDMRIVIDTDSATANTHVLFLGNSAIYAKAGAGWTSNGSATVTIPDAAGVDVASALSTQLQNQTFQISNMTVECAMSASGTTDVSAAQVYENMIRYERSFGLAEKKDVINVRSQRNPMFFTQTYVNVNLPLEQGLLNPLTCFAIPVVRAKQTVNITLDFTVRAPGLI